MTTQPTNFPRRTFLKTAVAGLGVGGLQLRAAYGAAPEKPRTGKTQLSEEHLAAVSRRRRIVVNCDALNAFLRMPGLEPSKVGDLAELHFLNADAEGSQLDSIFWSWSYGDEVPYASKIFPTCDNPVFKKLVAAGVNVMQVLLEQSKKRGLENFFSYRINGSDNLDPPGTHLTAMKKAHPDWLINFNPDPTGPPVHNPPWHLAPHWNFAIKDLRDYKLSFLREIAENYDFDGIEIDFARTPFNLPIGHQWEQREHLTRFMRALRGILLEVAEKRGRPFLLAARIPENLEGCHYDGIDVESWVRQQLVDILVLGIRSFDVDVEAFRHIAGGATIKLYPCCDEGHTTDGYRPAPTNVLRGVMANWHQQGADGVYTFNWSLGPPAMYRRLGFRVVVPYWPTQRSLYQEMGAAETLKHKDKTFVIQRRGGGHAPALSPVPDESWHTTRWYFNTNMFAQLPAKLVNSDKTETLLRVRMADDVAADAQRIKRLAVRVLLSDPAAKGLPKAERLDPVTITDYIRTLKTIPPAKGIEDHIELRLNNILLGRPTAEAGWLVFPAKPKQFAVGSNLVGIRVTGRPPDVQDAISIEKFEVDVDYR